MSWFMLCVLLLSSFMLHGILPVMLHVLILLECVRRTMKADTDQGNMNHVSCFVPHAVLLRVMLHVMLCAS